MRKNKQFGKMGNNEQNFVNEEEHEKNGYKEIIQLFEQFQTKTENVINKIYIDINSIRKENESIKKELGDVKLQLEQIKSVGNNIQNERVLVDLISEKISNQTSVLKQLFENLNNQIKNIQYNINNDENKINAKNMQIEENKMGNIMNMDDHLKNNKKSEKINIINNRKYNKNFHYLCIDDDLDNFLNQILTKSIAHNKDIELNKNYNIELQEIEGRNQDIYSKIKKQISNYKTTKEDYMTKGAYFLKNIGFLVRFSHEISNYLIIKFLDIFKEKVGFHSLDEETIRLYFSCWIRKNINENCFFKIVNNKKILSKMDNLLENSESKLFLDLFPKLIQLYLYCYLTDIKVNIIYANEDDSFDWESMQDDLISDSEIEKKVLFTFLPGLYANEQYFKYSTIYVVTYKVDNPNKFPFEKPIFSKIESTPEINLIKTINEINIFYEKKRKSKMVKLKLNYK